MGTQLSQVFQAFLRTLQVHLFLLFMLLLPIASADPPRKHDSIVSGMGSADDVASTIGSDEDEDSAGSIALNVSVGTTGTSRLIQMKSSILVSEMIQISVMEILHELMDKSSGLGDFRACKLVRTSFPSIACSFH